MLKILLIQTKYCRYVWYPALQLVDCIPKGKSTPTHTVYLRESDNTELRAMIKATDHMLKMLKEIRKKNDST